LKEETKANLIKFFESNPDSLTFPIIADFELQQDNIEQALEILNQGLNYHPDYAYGHYVLSKVLLKQGDIDNAIEELKLTIKYDPDFLHALYDIIEYGIDNLSEKDSEHYLERIKLLNPFEKKDYFEEKRNLFKEKKTHEEEGELKTTETEEKDEAIEGEPSFDIVEKEVIPEEEAHLGPVEDITKETEEINKKIEEKKEIEEHESTEKPQPSQSKDRLTSIIEKLKSAPYGSLGPLDIEEFKDIELAESHEEEDTERMIESQLKEEEKSAVKEPSEKPEEVITKEEQGKTEKPTETEEKTEVELEEKEKKVFKEEKVEEVKVQERHPGAEIEEVTSDERESLELKIPVPTFTLVEVLIKQKLYDQALEVLKVLEKRKKDIDKVEEYRKQIAELKEKEKEK